jgi:anaerobic selenocysteine-containing dehydrogenase
MIKSACGLDCPDACSILIDPSTFPKLEGDTNNSALCRLLNKDMFEAKRIEKPSINGVEVTMEEALDATAEALKESALLWRGSGNFGVMQEITDLLFEKIDGTLTKGSLCDGAGDAGICEGRGVNRMLPLEQIQKAEVVVVWGKNPSITSQHLLPYLKDKDIVVIDPIATSFAKKADLHIQIKPRSDIYLALLLSRFIYMEDSEDKEWLEELAPDFQDYYDFTREFRIKAILSHIGIELGMLGELLSYIQKERVVFLVGNGVQKYSIGHYTLWAIDSLAATLGLFGKEGCGVGYLGNSKLGFDNPFAVQCKRVSKVDTPFDKFDTILIQGGNPAESMPNSSQVQERLGSVKDIIYFGLYENESSTLANIIIPAKNFFEKDDVRLSYGDYTVKKMHKVLQSDIGISEYEFCQAISSRLGLEGLKTQEEYLESWIEQCEETKSGYLSPAYQELPYSDGFGEDGDDEFTFIDDFDDFFENIKNLQRAKKSRKKEQTISEYWLLTPKAKDALNTQFARTNSIRVHPDLGYSDGEEVLVSSQNGSYQFVIINDDNIREDCVVITANSIGVNYLTPSIISEEGESACYQEVKVTLKSI